MNNGQVCDLTAPTTDTRLDADSPPCVTEPRPLRLNLGSGDTTLPGFSNVDRKFGQEVYPLAYPDGSADEIYASHVLEHFPFEQCEAVLKDWVRVLKPGGRIRIAVPDFGYMAASYVAGRPTQVAPEHFIMGGHSTPNDFHHSIHDYAGLYTLFVRCGLFGIGSWKPEIQDCASIEGSLNLMGYKPTADWDKSKWFGKVALVMTLPRLTFSDNQYSLLRTMRECRMDMAMFTGAFWHQCIERCIEDALKTNPRYIMACDYDTVFEPSDLERLAFIMERNPDVMALAPMQAKRGGKQILMGKKSVPRTSLYTEVLDVEWAHFGLTLIRPEVFKDLPHPWFHDQPDKDGRWTEDKTDADIRFWRMLKERGHRVCVTPRVSVGHMETLIAWSDLRNMRIIHQTPEDYRISGTPVDTVL